MSATGGKQTLAVTVHDDDQEHDAGECGYAHLAPIKEGVFVTVGRPAADADVAVLQSKRGHSSDKNKKEPSQREVSTRVTAEHAAESLMRTWTNGANVRNGGSGPSDVGGNPRSRPHLGILARWYDRYVAHCIWQHRTAALGCPCHVVQGKP